MPWYSLGDECIGLNILGHEEVNLAIFIPEPRMSSEAFTVWPC